MRKFAAHYLLTDTGALLKNGIAVVGDDGFIVKYIDTTDDLKELEQMIFHSGLLMGAYRLVKKHSSEMTSSEMDALKFTVLQSVNNSDQLSFSEVIDMSRQIQEQFPDMQIPAILDSILKILLSQAGFSKEYLPGVYLLAGLDLAGLHFTPGSRLKKIL